MFSRNFEETSKAVSRQFPECFMEDSGEFNCTGGAGVAQKSGIELNSGLRVWVSVTYHVLGPPTRFADMEILDPVLDLILQVLNCARNA